MDISVVIVNWNTKRYLQECLKSVSETLPNRSMEVIVVDNGSTDGSAEMVEVMFPLVKLIRSRENLGFAKANNLAIRQCVGRYISLVNSDVRVASGCFDALATFLDNNPRVGNAGPRILNADGTLQSSCRKFPTLWNSLCSAFGFATAFKNSPLFSGEPMLYFQHDRQVFVDVLVGCFWMLRREAVEAVGGLDEDFFMYGEDVDWCRRCWEQKWQVAFFPDAEAIHYRGSSSAADPVRWAVAQQDSILHYWRKHHGVAGRAAIRNILFCRHALRYLFGVVSRYARTPVTTPSPTRVPVSAACLQALLSRDPVRHA